VIDCAPDQGSICKALAQLRSPSFQKQLDSVENPYERAGASEKVVTILEDKEIGGIIRKFFYEL